MNLIRRDQFQQRIDQALLKGALIPFLCQPDYGFQQMLPVYFQRTGNGFGHIWSGYASDSPSGAASTMHYLLLAVLTKALSQWHQIAHFFFM